MQKRFHQLEKFIDKLIPYMVFLLLGVIIVTFFFKEFAHHYEHQIEILDHIIIGTFVIDLLFKFIRVRKIKKFVNIFFSWFPPLALSRSGIRVYSQPIILL